MAATVVQGSRRHRILKQGNLLKIVIGPPSQRSESMKNLEALESENERLQIMAQMDSLTGALNRKRMEEKIGEILKCGTAGVFLMIDVDEFKVINNEYGHLVGDKVLCEIVKMMRYVFFKKDLIGRMGGDEFAIFMPGEYEEELVVSKINTLESRIVQVGQQIGIGHRLSFTAGGCFARGEDTFQQIYERADIAMVNGKRNGKKSISFYVPSMELHGFDSRAVAEPLVFKTDMRHICQELKEKGELEGVYCLDYHTFLALYRYFERLLGRIGLKVHLILVSLIDDQGEFLSLEERGSRLKSFGIVSAHLCGSAISIRITVAASFLLWHQGLARKIWILLQAGSSRIFAEMIR